MKPLGCKQIFKRKIEVNGTIDKFKARLVIQGFRQKEGIDYFDTYAPVARITTIRLLLALTAIYNLVIHQMDVKTTFLNGDLEEEVYMKQPKGFVMPDCSLVSTPMDMVEKLKLNAGKHVDQLEYLRAIGCLMYDTTSTRPNIAYAVGRLSRAISWASKKQTCITGSTIESEFVALDVVGKEAEWLRNLIHEIPIWPKPISPISIHCDSAATLAKAYSQIYNSKSRYLGEHHEYFDLLTCISQHLLSGAIDGSEVNEIIQNPKWELESSCFTFDLVPLVVRSVYDRGVTEEREDVREIFQQRRSGAKRKLSKCGRNQMGNELILALPEGAYDFVVYYDARNKDLEACLEKKREGDCLYVATTEGGLNMRHSRWMKLFSKCGFEVKYHLGKANVVVESWSRKKSEAKNEFWIDVRISIWRDVRTLAIEEAYTTKYSIHPGADTMLCGFRLTNRWLSMKKDIASCGSKYLAYSEVEVEYQGSSGLYVWSLEDSGEFSVKSIRQVIDANCFPVIHSATRWVKSVPLKLARKISSWWNVDYVDVSSYEEWYTWLVSLRLQANLKAVFEGIFYCLWWSVWMFRNKILFEKDTPSQARIFDNIIVRDICEVFVDLKLAIRQDLGFIPSGNVVLSSTYVGKILGADQLLVILCYRYQESGIGYWILSMTISGSGVTFLPSEHHEVRRSG
ncbi:zinc finger, CCHC-type containing protein [Tanacetum coccineum]